MSIGSRNDSRTRGAMLLAAISAGAFTWALWTTSGATPIGVTTNSVVYLTAAQQIAGGHGFVSLDPSGSLSPVRHFPPLYPVVLAGLSRMSGIGVVDAARWWNCALLGVNALLMVLLVRRMTASPMAGLLAGTWFVLSPSTLTVHLHAWTEPTFLALTLVSLLAFLYDDRHPSSLALCTSAAAAGLASLARFAGAPLAVAGLLVLMSRHRWRASAVWLALACLPLAAVLLINSPDAGTVANRQLTVHPVGVAHLRDALDAVQMWIFPKRLPASAQLLVAAGVIGSMVKVLWRRARLLLFFACAYVTFIVATVCFGDAATPFDYRILFPLYPFAIGSLVGFGSFRPDAMSAPLMSRAMLVLGLALVVPQVYVSARAGLQFREQGSGLLSARWQTSPTLASLRGFADDTPVHSNGWDAIYFLTGRRARAVPQLYAPVSLRPNPSYEQEVESLGSGVLVYFHEMSFRTYLPSRDRLRRDVPVTREFEWADGSVDVIAPRTMLADASVP
jgi:hypothetical protein